MEEAWSWQEDASQLWQDLSQTETSVSSLFASTPSYDIAHSQSFGFILQKQDDLEQNHHLGDHYPPLKRRRMLQFQAQEAQPTPYELHLDILKCNRSSIWYIGQDKSLSSVDDDGDDGKRSDEGWITRFLDERVGQSNDSINRKMASPLNTMPDIYTVDRHAETNLYGMEIARTNQLDLKSKLATGELNFKSKRSKLATDELNLRSKLATDELNLKSKLATDELNLRSKLATDELNLNSKLTTHELNLNSKLATYELNLKAKLATPVAYPFAVVKPAGMLGDVTLNDINQRISMHPNKPVVQDVAPILTENERHPSSIASSTGKFVVALTKIYTEGKGTITIIRTKS